MITQNEAAPTATAPPTKRKSKRINHSTSPRPAGFVVAALQQFIGDAFIAEMRQTVEVYDTPFSQEEVANGVVHPVTKEHITKYRQLIANPITREVWEKAMCKELGWLTQG